MEKQTDNINNTIMEKLTQFTEILQNFGMNLITKIGEFKHSNDLLVSKMENLEKEVIAIKGIKNQLSELTRERERFVNKVTDIENALKIINSKVSSPNLTPNPIDDSPDSLTSLDFSKDYEVGAKVIKTPLEHLNLLKESISNQNRISGLVSLLSQTKEALFLITGGHKVLFEIKEYIKKLKSKNDNNLDEMKKILRDKVESWKISFQ